MSFKTVSRVVNGEGGVSAPLVQRVEEAVRALNYRPDERARRLRQSGSAATTIGFVMVDVANQFFGTLLRGIEDVAISRSCLVLSGSTDRSPERERQLIESFVDRRVDGLVIIYCGSSPAHLNAEIARGTPIVFLDLEPEAVEADLVRTDHYAGARLATQHLIDHGHRDIAYFGDDSTIFSATLRLQGYRDAMADAGIEEEPHRIVTASRSQSEWEAIIFQNLRSEPRPTAIFTAQNLITVGALGALHDLDLHRTIAQVGFDDIDLGDVVEPAVTVVPQNPLELGRKAAQQLFARIGGDESPARKQIFVPPLIERGSGEIAPFR